jgi:hypothetical protein
MDSVKYCLEALAFLIRTNRDEKQLQRSELFVFDFVYRLRQQTFTGPSEYEGEGFSPGGLSTSDGVGWQLESLD